MLKKNCHQVFGSQKSKLTLLELVFQTAGAINPPPHITHRVKTCEFLSFFTTQNFLLRTFYTPLRPICTYIGTQVSYFLDEGWNESLTVDIRKSPVIKNFVSNLPYFSFSFFIFNVIHNFFRLWCSLYPNKVYVFDLVQLEDDKSV